MLVLRGWQSVNGHLSLFVVKVVIQVTPFFCFTFYLSETKVFSRLFLVGNQTDIQRTYDGNPQVYGLYQNGHKVYINMEYAENGDLFTYLRNNTLTEPQIRSWITQILFAFRLVFQRIYFNGCTQRTKHQFEPSKTIRNNRFWPYVYSLLLTTFADLKYAL